MAVHQQTDAGVQINEGQYIFYDINTDKNMWGTYVKTTNHYNQCIILHAVKFTSKHPHIGDFALFISGSREWF